MLTDRQYAAIGKKIDWDSLKPIRYIPFKDGRRTKIAITMNSRATSMALIPEEFMPSNWENHKIKQLPRASLDKYLDIFNNLGHAEDVVNLEPTGYKLDGTREVILEYKIMDPKNENHAEQRFYLNKRDLKRFGALSKYKICVNTLSPMYIFLYADCIVGVLASCRKYTDNLILA